MKVLLTGGTGFPGKNVAAALHAGGHRLRLRARSEGNLAGLPPGGCDAMLRLAAQVKMGAPDPAVLQGAVPGGQAC